VFICLLFVGCYTGDEGDSGKERSREQWKKEKVWCGYDGWGFALFCLIFNDIAATPSSLLPYWILRSDFKVLSVWYVVRLPVCLCVTFSAVAKQRVSDGTVGKSYKLSAVTISLCAAIWSQFATQVCVGGIGNYRYMLSLYRKLCCNLYCISWLTGAGNKIFKT